MLVASAFLVLAPLEWLEALSLTAVRTVYQLFFATALVLSGAYLIVAIAMGIWEYVGKRLRWHFNERRMRKNLQDLTADERVLLRPFVFDGQSKIQMPMNDGTVNLLEVKTVLLRSSTLSYHGGYFDYIIQPWALEELKRHPELLAELPEEKGRR